MCAVINCSVLTSALRLFVKWCRGTLQPAGVDRQLGRRVIQTLALGLRAGSFGALRRRRPALHPRVFPQHVDEPEGWQSGSKDTGLELFAEDGRDKLPSLLFTGWCRCPHSTGPLWAP